jgi:hypothetical protein
MTYGSRPERAWPPWPPTTTTVRPALTSAAVTCSRAPTWWFNPAAKTTPGAPIYGMPILEVAEAQQVVFLKRSMRPGFAGIENELLHDPRTTLLFGDAKESLTKGGQQRQDPVSTGGQRQARVSCSAPGRSAPTAPTASRLR